MAWFDEFNLPGATIDGYFGFIHADGPDDDEYPDVVLANGTVTFTATTEAARIDGAWLGIEAVTAQIFEGRIVISEEDPRPVRLLATDADIGVEDWAWRATFDVPGFKLDPLTFRAPRNTTVNLTSGIVPTKSAPYQIVQGEQGASITDVAQVAPDAMRVVIEDPATGEQKSTTILLPEGPRGPEGPYGGTEVTDPQVASYIGADTATTAALQDRAWQGTMARFPKLAGDLDDTERLQRALAWCAGAGRGLSLAGDPWISGPYMVRELTVPAGLPLLDLAGATLKRPALGEAPYNYTVEQKKWSRMIAVSHTGEADSPVVMIQDGTLDGNCWENWSDNANPSYEQEQASLIIVQGDRTSGGRARVRLRGVSFRDSVSDGLHVTNDAVAEVADCTSHDCFRGGLTVTGGGTTINASGWVSTSSRASMPDGVDIEVDGHGYNGTSFLNANLSSFTIDRDLDVSVPVGGHVSLTDVVLKTPGWNLGAFGGTLVVNGGRLAQNAAGRLLVRDGARIMFYGTQLLGSGPGTGVAMPMQFFAAASTPAQATVTFSGVDFQQCATGISGNRGGFVDVVVTGQTRFGEDVDLAIGGSYSSVAFRPRVVEINGASFGNTGYWLQAAASPTRVEVNGITVTNPASQGARLGGVSLTWGSMVTMSHGVRFAAVPGGAVTVTGNRMALVDVDPNDSTAWGSGRLFGTAGDVAMLRDRSRRWVCIGYDGRPGMNRYIWEERAVGAKTTGPTGDRPVTTVAGTQYLDTTLGKPIWWTGTEWVDGTGAAA